MAVLIFNLIATRLERQQIGIAQISFGSKRPQQRRQAIELLAAFPVHLVDESFLLDLAHNGVIDQSVQGRFASRILL